MFKLSPLIFAALLMIVFYSCSKKTQPSKSTVLTEEKSDTTLTITKTDSIVAKKPVVRRTPKASTPKVITVSDQAAKRSVDGRYYYDLQGHRYWKNNKDGKYYIYNKSMNTDPNFKSPN
ncbi:hypothetical protein BH11BAC3_BH11BAC3_03780 [soil metagenome]